MSVKQTWTDPRGEIATLQYGRLQNPTTVMGRPSGEEVNEETADLNTAADPADLTNILPPPVCSATSSFTQYGNGDETEDTQGSGVCSMFSI